MRLTCVLRPHAAKHGPAAGGWEGRIGHFKTVAAIGAHCPIGHNGGISNVYVISAKKL